MPKVRTKYVTVKEFLQQVKNVEGFDIRIKDNKTGNVVDENLLIKRYPFKNPAPDNMSVAEFWKKRIKPCFLTNNIHCQYIITAGV